MLTAKVPGKLFIAGEYAVVTPGNSAIIAAVSRYLTVTLRSTRANCASISSTQNPYEITQWTRHHQHLQLLTTKNTYPLITTAMLTAEAYAQELGYWNPNLYHLHVSSELDDPKSKKKLGLGSSGAVVVATIRAVLEFHGVPQTNLLIYKLAALTHTRLHLNGSMGDLAACAFGGIIHYCRSDSFWLNQQLQTMTIASIVQKKWPQLIIQRLSLPEELFFLVGWTKQQANTAQLVTTAQNNQNWLRNEEFYHHFLQHNQSIMSQLIKGCQLQQSADIHQAILKNRQLLLDFSKNMHITIETPSLNYLCESAIKNGASAKTSGAGGGDCGICFASHSKQVRHIQEDWKKQGIVPLDLTITHPITF